MYNPRAVSSPRTRPGREPPSAILESKIWYFVKFPHWMEVRQTNETPLLQLGFILLYADLDSVNPPTIVFGIDLLVTK